MSSPCGPETRFFMVADVTAKRLFGGSSTSLSRGYTLTLSSWKPSSKLSSKIVPLPNCAVWHATLKSKVLDVKLQKISSSPRW